MSKNILLFCEGTSESYDNRILSHLKSSLRNNNCEIIPMGTKNTRTGFVQGYISNDIFAHAVVVFRDRDFSTEPSSSLFLKKQQNIKKETNNERYQLPYKEYVGNRTTIENYLLSPDWFYEYVQQSKQSRAKKQITSVDSVHNVFKNAANSIKYYSAARYAIGKLFDENKEKTFLNSTWLKESGVLPPKESLQDKRHHLERGIEHLVNYQEAFKPFSKERFEEHFNTYSDKFENEDFDPLVWFNGKDLHRAIQNIVGEHIACEGQEGYYHFVLKNKIEQIIHSDLQELFSIIDSL